jgi:hypothetical protein
MKKQIIFICILVLGGLAYLGQDTLFNDQDVVKTNIVDVIKDKGNSPETVSQQDESQPKVTVEPTEISVENVALTMTESQKEKYSNLSDTKRAEMIEVLSATDESNDTVSAGARKYFDLANDDKKFEKLDAEIEETIAQLNLLPSNNNANSTAPNISAATSK